MNVLLPTTLAQACELLSTHDADGPAIPMAGATDLFVHWPIRQADHDRTYLNLSGIAELRGIVWSAEALTLGAMTTYWDVIQDKQAAEEFPILIEAARQIGAIQIQSRGTWAGNIANGSPAADGVLALMAYDASVTLVSRAGARTVPLTEFYLGYRKSVRRPDELISAVSIPRRAYDLAVFHKVGPRRAQAISKIGLAITHETGDAECRVLDAHNAPPPLSGPGGAAECPPFSGPGGAADGSHGWSESPSGTRGFGAPIVAAPGGAEEAYVVPPAPGPANPPGKRTPAKSGWRVVANSVAPTVRRCPTIERLLNDAVPVSSPDGFLAAADADVSPIDDIRSTAEYRRTVLCRLLYYSLKGRCPSVR